VGGVFTTLYLFFLAQTLQRHRLLDLHELIGKVASVSALALMLALVYGVIGFWLKDRPGLFVFNTVIASFVILSLYEPLRAKVEEQVLASLFRERFELIRTLAGLRARLSSVVTPAQMAALVLDTLQDSRRVTHTSFYLLADDRPGFRLLDHRGPLPPIPFLEAAAARGLLASAAAGERALLLEVVDRKLGEITGAASAGGGTDPEAARFEGVKAAMTQMCSGISFPLIAGDRVLGFWNLWDDRVPEAYSSDEIAAMLEVAERAAVVLESSQLFERMKERDRLAALGEMAAGLAHEIRNPLGAIKGAAQYLDPTGRPGDEGNLLQVIVEEVNRLNGVVTEFLDYARPIKSQLAPINLNDILQRTVTLLQSQGLPPGVSIDLQLGEDLPPAQGDAEQLKQVFINLAFNAIQAMPKGGTLTIRTAALAASSATWRFAEVGPSRGRKAGGPDLMEVRFRDTGEGISADVRERIFIPFYTTKAKGTGLGLAIVQRIIKSHNGLISVESQPGLGTEFVVRIPIAGDQLTPSPVNKPMDTPTPKVRNGAAREVPTPLPPRPDSGPGSRPPDLQPRKDSRRRRQRSR
jgi:signal transduction histidine kinase